jgi:hypothetical protein
MSSRAALQAWLLEQYGAPYVWSAKGGLRKVDGRERPCFDCSGLVTSALLEAGHPRLCAQCGQGLRTWHNAQRLWDELEPTETPGELDLAFYGLDGQHVNHVMFCWPDGRAYGAAGGNSGTVDPAEALRRGAKVQFRSSPTYRPDFLGYRKLPL